MACPLAQGQSRGSPCLQDLVGQGEMRPLQMGKAQRDRGCDGGGDEYAVQARRVGAGGGCRVCRPLGEAPGTPPRLPVCRGYYSALCVAQTFLPPEPRERQ